MPNSNIAIIEKIKLLNNPRFGALGEHIFEYKNLDQDIKRKHSENTDFILNGRSIDVKSRRLFKSSSAFARKYSGKKIDNIDYYYLQFYSTEVICSLEGNKVFSINYDCVEKLYNNWKSRKEIRLSNSVDKLSQNYKNNLNIIRKEIIDYCKKQGLSPRIIYRTNQKQFGKESPDNLLPKTIRNNSITIFLSFIDYKISRTNLDYIIAFLDKDSGTFPILKNPMLHKEKVDLENLNEKYRFNTLSELYQRRCV